MSPFSKTNITIANITTIFLYFIADQIQIDTEINKLRSDQKVLVNKHRDLEHKTAYPGTHLKAMSHDEMSALKRNLPLGTS